MTGRQQTLKYVTTRLPVQAPNHRSAQRIPVQIMVCFSATDSFPHAGSGK